MQGAVVIEKSESDSESVVAGDQEGEEVVEAVSDAVGDGDGEGAEADNLEIFCVNIDIFGFYVAASELTFPFLLEH